MTRKALRCNLYAVVSRALEEGIAYGVARADKYVDDDAALTDAQRERVIEAVSAAVMNALCEVIDFGV